MDDNHRQQGAALVSQMLLFYFINLVKIEIFWLSKKVEMTYILG
jgi:hypothetical protein